jgi:hypothetical protein
LRYVRVCWLFAYYLKVFGRRLLKPILDV